MYTERVISSVIKGDCEIKKFVEIYADSAGDVPEPKENWSAGSIAYDISTGTFYMLNSSGVWVNQDNFSELEQDSGTNVALNISSSAFNLDGNHFLNPTNEKDEIQEELEETEVQDESLGHVESE